MPIYEYHCLKCQKEFELLRPLSQSNESVICPSCGGEGQKLVSGYAAKLGFYVRPSLSPFREKGKAARATARHK